MCSGKVYYDLAAARDAAALWDVEILRVEQLYPFPSKALTETLSEVPGATFVWCQEEPRNMGYWTFLEPTIESVLTKIAGETKRPSYVGRPPTASTATGIASKHKEQQDALVEDALS